MDLKTRPTPVPYLATSGVAPFRADLRNLRVSCSACALSKYFTHSPTPRGTRVASYSSVCPRAKPEASLAKRASLWSQCAPPRHKDQGALSCVDEPTSAPQLWMRGRCLLPLSRASGLVCVRVPRSSCSTARRPRRGGHGRGAPASCGMQDASLHHPRPRRASSLVGGGVGGGRCGVEAHLLLEGLLHLKEVRLELLLLAQLALLDLPCRHLGLVAAATLLCALL